MRYFRIASLLVMIVLLVACGTSTASVEAGQYGLWTSMPELSTKEDVATESEIQLFSYEAWVEACVLLGREPTAKDLVDDYLSDEGRLSGLYVHSTDEGGEWLSFYLPGSDYFLNGVYVNATHRQTDDNTAPEIGEVMSAALLGIDNWTTYRGKGVHLLWSDDYEYCFMIPGDGWIYVDGCRAAPYPSNDDEPRLLDPMDLKQAYLAAEWDGKRIWSNDYGTVAYIGGDGQLKYEYYNPLFVPHNSKDDRYCYANCELEPWWSLEHNYVVEKEYTSFNGEHLAMSSVAMSDWWLDWPDEAERTVHGRIIRTAWDVDGLWVFTTQGLFHYQRGQLIDSWECAVDPFLGKTTACGVSDEVLPYKYRYLYTGEQLLSVEADGKLCVIVDHVLKVRTDNGLYFRAYYNAHGTQWCYEDWCGQITITQVC